MRSILGHLVYFDYNAGYGIRIVTCMWDLQDSHPRQSEQGGHSGHWEEAFEIATRICKTKGAPAPKVLQGWDANRQTGPKGLMHDCYSCQTPIKEGADRPGLYLPPRHTYLADPGEIQLSLIKAFIDWVNLFLSATVQPKWWGIKPNDRKQTIWKIFRISKTQEEILTAHWYKS